MAPTASPLHQRPLEEPLQLIWSNNHRTLTPCWPPLMPRPMIEGPTPVPPLPSPQVPTAHNALPRASNNTNAKLHIINNPYSKPTPDKFDKDLTPEKLEHLSILEEKEKRNEQCSIIAASESMRTRSIPSLTPQTTAPCLFSMAPPLP